MQELAQPPKGQIKALINTDLKASVSKNPVQMFLFGFNPKKGQYVEKLCAPNAVNWVLEQAPEHTEVEIPEALMAYADPALPAPPRTVSFTVRENNIKICGCLC